MLHSHYSNLILHGHAISSSKPMNPMEKSKTWKALQGEIIEEINLRYHKFRKKKGVLFPTSLPGAMLFVVICITSILPTPFPSFLFFSLETFSLCCVFWEHCYVNPGFLPNCWSISIYPIFVDLYQVILTKAHSLLVKFPN